MQISNGPDDKMYDLIKDGEDLIVNPWPFDKKSFFVSYEVRTLKQLNFANDEDFRELLYHTAPTQRQIKIKRA